MTQATKAKWLAVVAALAMMGTLRAQSSGSVKPVKSAGQTVSALPESAWDLAKARHLLFRAGFGGTPEEVAKLHAMGLQQAVEHLVDYANQSDLEVVPPTFPDRSEIAEKLRQMPAEERRKFTQQLMREDRQRMQALQAWWVKRMIGSPRPLEEKMVLFWHGHFASEYRTVRGSEPMYNQNQLFRKHAVGNFGKLLHAIIRDPAMLRYLDNDRNIKGRPNENLAREIMELFSMGEGNYSEKDIKEGARALTGYTTDRPVVGGGFRFAERAHDAGPKTIFGKTGNWNGDQFVDLILKQPATARFIARKLFVYFVHENPTAPTIDALAEVLRKHQYQITPLLKVMFTSEEFYSPRAIGTQIKSPVQVVVGTLRTLPGLKLEPPALVMAMRNMGQELFEPPNVKGWDGGRTWISTGQMFVRDNFAVVAVANVPPGAAFGVAGKNAPKRKFVQQPGVGADRIRARVDLVALLEHEKTSDATQVIDCLARRLLALPLGAQQRAELLTKLGTLPPASEWADKREEVNRMLATALILLLTMPEYQMT